jgi:outer membrane protein
MEKIKRFCDLAHSMMPINWRGRPIIQLLVLVLALAAGGTIIHGCAHNAPRVYGSPGVSERPDVPWNPPEKAIKDQEVFRSASAKANIDSSLITANLPANIQNLALADIVNIALINNKQTRQAWAQARAAAASYGRERGSYLPNINGTASAGRQKNATGGGQFSSGVRIWSASASLNWLVFDFGGRHASIEETRQTMFAADWEHNTVIQNVVLQVEQAYYDYYVSKALVSAQQASVDEAQTNLNVSEGRHTSGLATIADVLQSRTALSQAVLTLESLKGRIMTTRGVLATAMGLPANTAFDVELPVEAPPLERAKKSVEEYLDTAWKDRPDLASAQAQAIAREAHTRSVQAQGLPSITAGGSAGRLYLNSFSNRNNTYNATIEIGVPFFTGFAHHYDVQESRAQAEAAVANARNVRDLVTLQVWTSYYTLETADQMVRTSEDLLASATQNHEVAAARYKDGVGTILDLLTAQSALENARAQQIQARADWWVAFAQLAHDTGSLEAVPASARSTK